jgi:regulator of RNase E activity RraA
MPDILGTYGAYSHLLYSGVLADVLDALGWRTSALPAEVRPLNPGWKLFGRAATLDTVAALVQPARPYAVELECIDALQPGDVLVATTGGNRTCSLWGELLSTAARAHGAVGAVLDGMTRDTSKILEMNFPVFATGFHPFDSKGRLEAICHGRPIRVGDCLVKPGDWVFGDVDGVVVIPAELAEQAIPRALEKASGENRVREELARGRSVQEVFNEYGIL